MISTKRFGLRTASMWVCAYIWIGLGIGAFQEVPVVRPGVFHLTVDAQIRGWLWLATALVAVATSLSRRLSSLGLALLFVMPGLTAVSYASAWVLFKVPGGSPGYPNGWYSSYLYLGLMAWVIITACIPSRPAAEPRPLKGSEL